MCITLVTVEHNVRIMSKLPSYAVPARKLTEKRMSTSVRLSQRVWLYTKENLDFTRTVEGALRTSLEAIGIDLSVPHPKEVVGELDGKPITFADAVKEGLYDKHGNLLDNPGVAIDDQPAGVVL